MVNSKRYRITPHQSELAVKIFGSSQAELFENSGSALFDVITDPDKVDIKDRLPLEVEGTDRDDLRNERRELPPESRCRAPDRTGAPANTRDNQDHLRLTLRDNQHAKTLARRA